MVEKVGLIGIGLVGTAIAERLLISKFDVIGFDIDSTRCRHVVELGAKAAASAAEVAHRTRRVVLSLPDTAVVLQVVAGAGGILEAKTLPECIIDTTTGDPEKTEALARQLATNNIYFLDSTISGSSQQLRCGEAVLMVGGDKAAFARCRDIFQALTGKVFYLGTSGSGCRAKLASNLVLGLNRVALAEGLVFAKKLGLEPEAFLELLKSTAAYSAVMDLKGKRMLNGDFKPESRIRQHHKDVSLILKYAEKTAVELPLSRTHLGILKQAIEAGDGDLDNSAIIRQIERQTPC